MLTYISLAVVISEIVCLIISWKAIGKAMFIYYTILSNCMATVSTALLLAVQTGTGTGSASGTFLADFRYLSVCMMTMTCLVVIFVLLPMSKSPDERKALFAGTQFFYHLLCPVLTLVSYVLWEDHSRAWYLPAIATIVYGLVTMYFNYTGKLDGPYPFVRVRHQSRIATAVWIVVMFGVIAGIAFGVITLGNIVK